MRYMKALIASSLCLAIFCTLSVSAFACVYTGAHDTSKDNTNITLYNHGDVVVREQPTTSSPKEHTLYVGDLVYIYDWQTNQYLTDGHYWAYLRHYDTNNRAYYYGYSANCLLS